jgi:hypothetical protein
MPLNSFEDCQDKAKVWSELSSTYGQMRNWTADDLKFMAPTLQKMNAIRPPFTVRMAPGDEGVADPATGPGGQPLVGTWRYVEIAGTDVAKGGKGYVRVGRVRDW